MKVVQIILNELPTQLKECVASVQSFAEKQGCEYIVLTSIPGHLKGLCCLRTISNFMRMEYLSAFENTLYIDWDICLEKGFSIQNKRSFYFASGYDCLMYSGENCELFARILDSMQKDTVKNHLNIYRALLKNHDLHKVNTIVAANNYRHLRFTGRFRYRETDKKAWVMEK